MPDKKPRPNLLSDPDHWRKSASEMRGLAQISAGAARDSFVKIADEYDKLADRAEARLKMAKASD